VTAKVYSSNPWMNALGDEAEVAGPEFALQLLSGAEDLDARFESRYPRAIRQLSEIHWTPIRVVRRVVEQLVLRPGMRVLDVGCGPGKFCIVGSLLSGAQFVGVEQRPTLVDLATSTALALGAREASFVAGDAFELDWSGFDGVYLYNPFEEELFDRARWVDETLAFSEDRYHACIDLTEEKLGTLRKGALVSIYHGFGGKMPPGFTRRSFGFYGSGTLELWEKTSEAPG
jgi:SAM-dependent methyltransferase